MNGQTHDVTTASVVKARLEAILDEMDAVLYRSAFCPIMAEGHDACNGLYDSVTGETLLQGMSGLPSFVATMPFAVRELIASIERGRWSQAPGDVFMLNDPYVGGTHLQDVRLITPLFCGDDVFCYLACGGHHSDVGGAVPGGFNAEAREFYQEGVRIPLVKLVEDGRQDDAILDIMMANSRASDMMYGDMRAQLNALEVGQRRIAELLATHGEEAVRSCLQQVTTGAEEVMRRKIRTMPNGMYKFRDFLDDDGVTDEPLAVDVVLTVADESLRFDFCGSSDAGRGPMNATLPTTIASVYTAIKHMYPDVPSSGGVLKCIEIEVRKGSVLDAPIPAPVGGYLELTHRIAGVIFGVMAQVDPNNTYAAPYGTTNCLVIAGKRDDGSYFVMFSYFGGGMAGSSRSDGLSHGNNPIAHAPMPPVEVVEARYPVRFDQFRLRDGSAGAGEHRGGLGAVYEIALDADEAHAFFLGDRGRYAPFGVLGGGPSCLNEVSFSSAPVGSALDRLAAKATNVVMRRGDSVTIRTPGGGGYGDPLGRNAALVAEEVRREYLDAGQALTEYGVVLDDDLRLDEVATLQTRTRARSASTDSR